MILLISPNHANIVYPSEFVKSNPGIVIVSASFRVVELCLVKLGMDWNDILLPCSRAPVLPLAFYKAIMFVDFGCKFQAFNILFCFFLLASTSLQYTYFAFKYTRALVIVTGMKCKTSSSRMIERLLSGTYLLGSILLLRDPFFGLTNSPRS